MSKPAKSSSKNPDVVSVELDWLKKSPTVQPIESTLDLLSSLAFF